MSTILDFVPNDELKKYFWESEWHYCFSDDSEDELSLEKIKTKIKIERRPHL